MLETSTEREHTMFEHASKQRAVRLSIPPSCWYLLLLHLRHPDINIPERSIHFFTVFQS